MTVLHAPNYSKTDIEPLGDRESFDLFDRLARYHMGISGAEFLLRWDRGDYKGVDWDTVDGLVAVAMAVPFARQ